MRDAEMAFGELCQAHRTHRATCLVAWLSDERQYRLCARAARRLRRGTLRPLEVFNIISLHGLEPGGYLGTGPKGYHRYAPAGHPEHGLIRRLLVRLHAPKPRLQRGEQDIGRLLDCAALHYLDCDETERQTVVDILRASDTSGLCAEIRRRIEEGVPPPAEYAYYNVLGVVGDAHLADWVRQRWQAVTRFSFPALVRASHACLPPAERVSRALEEVRRLPEGERYDAYVAMGWLVEKLDRPTGWDACTRYLKLLPQRDQPRYGLNLLAGFRSPDSLAWIEENIFDPDTLDSAELRPEPDSILTKFRFEAWGQLASASQLTWARVMKWLRAGKPLSRVAIDALYACGAFEPDELAGRIGRMPRPLLNAADPERMTEILSAYAREDRDRTIVERVNAIIRNWERVIAGAPLRR